LQEVGVADPSKLGKYVIRRELGRGAMGVVYEGFDPFIERTVAIKTIKPELPGQAEAGELLGMVGNSRIKGTQYIIRI